MIRSCSNSLYTILGEGKAFRPFFDAFLSQGPGAGTDPAARVLDKLGITDFNKVVAAHQLPETPQHDILKM